jgi:hypothetical protein
VLGGCTASQLRVEFAVDAQMQWDIKAGGLLGDLGLDGLGFLRRNLGADLRSSGSVRRTGPRHS